MGVASWTRKYMDKRSGSRLLAFGTRFLRARCILRERSNTGCVRKRTICSGWLRPWDILGDCPGIWADRTASLATRNTLESSRGISRRRIPRDT